MSCQHSLVWRNPYVLCSMTIKVSSDHTMLSLLACWRIPIPERTRGCEVDISRQDGQRRLVARGCKGGGKD